MTKGRVVPGAEHPARLSIAVDWDGVIHSHVSPWTGDPTHIPDPPVPGAINWLTGMVEHYDVYIFTCRLLAANRSQVESAMRKWLWIQGCESPVINLLRFCYEKPHAVIYLDDRAVRFEGVFPTLDETHAAAVTWNKKPA